MEQTIIDLQNHTWVESTADRFIEFTPYKHGDNLNTFSFMAYDQDNRLTTLNNEHYILLKNAEGSVYLSVNGDQNRYFKIEHGLNCPILTLTDFNGNTQEYTGISRL
jgi:hypothetical protein